MNIKVMLVDDHRIFREGVSLLLQREKDLEVVAEAEDGRTALKLVRQSPPDVVLMDITLPELNGVEATRQIVREFPDVKVVALSMHSDRRSITEMLVAGAMGYLTKDCSREEMIKAIRTVVHSRIFLCSRAAHQVTQEFVRQAVLAQQEAPPVLSGREREVLQLIAEGRPTRGIASALHVSVKTVETHRKKIMQKLKLDNVADLVKYAVREGLTSLDT